MNEQPSTLEEIADNDLFKTNPLLHFADRILRNPRAAGMIDELSCITDVNRVNDLLTQAFSGGPWVVIAATQTPDGVGYCVAKLRTPLVSPPG